MAHAAALQQQTVLRSSSSIRLIYFIFTISGATSLVFETIFTRLLSYTFGNTAHAVSTVLAAFLGGLAAGAYVLGKLSDRHAGSLRWYAALESATDFYSLVIPALFALMTRVYVGAYHYFHPGPSVLLTLRFVLAAIPICIPAFLMGGTLPVLTRYLVSAQLGREAEINRLYGWNTIGAAIGTLVSTYLLIPMLGVNVTIWTACIADLAIAAIALLQASRGEVSVPGPAAVSPQPVSTATTRRFWLHALAFVTGAIALGYEVVWAHVQAFTIGNTVYAFGTMLFTVLCGLGLGAQLVSRRLQDQRLWAPALAASQSLLALTVFATLPLWGHMNFAFEHGFRGPLLAGVGGLFGFRLLCGKVNRRHQPSTPRFSRNRLLLSGAAFFAVTVTGAYLQRSGQINFAATELIRFFCGFYLLIIPALLLGMSFPLLLSMAASGHEATAASSVGTLYAANTFGAISGSVFTGFFVLPLLGSEVTLRTLAACDLLLGLVVGLALVPMLRPARLGLSACSCAVLLAGCFALPRWDVRTLLRGSYVYFEATQKPDRVLYSREDVQGGLTSVIQSGNVRIMLSNAKFQGDNGYEVASQSRFALIPAIFARQYRRALVIGLGTGNTLRVVSMFPFQKIEVAELAPNVVEAARRWFPDVNGRVIDTDSRVKVHITDGRNFLLLSRSDYDLITVEISSIWISGEADLYNREFYQLCRDHLSQGGVLQQWVQLHNMRTVDLLTIFNTAAHVFPHLAFFVGPGQGVLLASRTPLAFDFAKSEQLDSEANFRLEEQRLGVASLSSLMGELMLYDNSFRRAITFLPDGGGPRSRYISSDSQPYLEYATPKGNALSYDAFAANLAFLRPLRPLPLPPELPLLNLPSPNERSLILGYASEQRGDVPAALAYFAAVQGPNRPRAQAEIGRLTSRMRR